MFRFPLPLRRARRFCFAEQGTLYLGGYGIEERSAVSRLHDPANGIVTVIKCSNMHGDESLPDNKDYCDRSYERYRTYDYDKLMNTTFALVPSGRSPGTFRLGEVSPLLLLLVPCFLRYLVRFVYL